MSERVESPVLMEETVSEREALWRRRLDLEDRLGLRSGNEADYLTAEMLWKARIAKWGLKALGLYQRGLRNACHIKLREVRFAYPDLDPELDGFRILHLSDFHYPREDGDFAEAARHLLEGLEANLCVMTGDYRFGYFGPLGNVHEKLRDALAGVTAPLGACAVLGNHDLSETVPALESIGVRPLVNEGVLLTHGSAHLWIAGTDDPHRFECDNIGLAMDGAPEDAFRIALVHSPECIPEAESLGAHLYLCGHTHGGQICLPFFGAIHTNARCDARYSLGPWQYRGMHGYTTAGLGTTDLPVRYNCPPEAVRITLARA